MKKILAAIAALAFLATPALAIEVGPKTGIDWFVCKSEAGAKLIFDKAKADGVDSSYAVWQAQASASECLYVPGSSGEITEILETYELPAEDATITRYVVKFGASTILYGIMGEKAKALPGA